MKKQGTRWSSNFGILFSTECVVSVTVTKSQPSQIFGYGYSKKWFQKNDLKQKLQPLFYAKKKCFEIDTENAAKQKLI
jgi:hypothetical protein